MPSVSGWREGQIKLYHYPLRGEPVLTTLVGVACLIVGVLIGRWSNAPAPRPSMTSERLPEGEPIL